MTLIETLLGAGYSEKEIYHHYSDLYIFVNDLTREVIEEWFTKQGLNKKLFVSTFRDQITGKPMFEIAFQYYDFRKESTNEN